MKVPSDDVTGVAHSMDLSDVITSLRSRDPPTVTYNVQCCIWMDDVTVTDSNDHVVLRSSDYHVQPGACALDHQQKKKEVSVGEDSMDAFWYLFNYQ